MLLIMRPSRGAQCGRIDVECASSCTGGASSLPFDACFAMMRSKEDTISLKMTCASSFAAGLLLSETSVAT